MSSLQARSSLQACSSPHHFLSRALFRQLMHSHFPDARSTRNLPVAELLSLSLCSLLASSLCLTVSRSRRASESSRENLSGLWRRETHTRGDWLVLRGDQTLAWLPGGVSGMVCSLLRSIGKSWRCAQCAHCAHCAGAPLKYSLSLSFLSGTVALFDFSLNVSYLPSYNLLHRIGSLLPLARVGFRRDHWSVVATWAPGSPKMARSPGKIPTPKLKFTSKPTESLSGSMAVCARCMDQMLV